MSTIMSVEHIRTKVLELITIHEPDKTDSVNVLMKKWKGKENDLLRTLCENYKETYKQMSPIHLTNVYSIGSKLGVGGFAIARKLKRRLDGKKFALKIINTKYLCKDEINMMHTEISLHRKLSHSNIVKLYDVFHSVSKQCFVLELCEGGELFDKIIMEGHSPIKLIDFGMAATPNYVAPEILKREPYGTSVDMWSAGVILYIILCGFPPFYDENDDLGRLQRKIKTAEYDMPSPYWDNISYEAKDLVRKLLVIDPKKRLTAAQALQHEWFLILRVKWFDIQYLKTIDEKVQCIVFGYIRSNMNAEATIYSLIPYYTLAYYHKHL